MRWDRLLCMRRRKPGDTGEEPDMAVALQRDFRTIINSASFRRLQDKTQVFPLDGGDFVRTRMTHSLEVAALAKLLGQRVFETLRVSGEHPEITAETREAAYNILECAGLLHDIGNPPFGHFGESAIREWFKENLPRIKYSNRSLSGYLGEQMQNDFLHFEGNAQALRLVTKLHYSPDEGGMNLTYAVLNTILKYPVSSVAVKPDAGDIKAKKMGYTYAERDLFYEITDATGAGNNRYPLTFLLEAADDIAYTAADVEDAVKKGFLSAHRIYEELKSDWRRGRTDNAEERKFYDSAVERLEKTFEIRTWKGRGIPEVGALQNWLYYVQNRLADCAVNTFVKNYDSIMDGGFGSDLISASPGRALVGALGDIASSYVFRSNYIIRLEIAAGRIIGNLLDSFVPAAVLYETGSPATPIDERLMAVISDNYKYGYEYYARNADDREKLYLRLLLVTDFICGMTDGYAKSLYQHLNGTDGQNGTFWQ